MPQQINSISAAINAVRRQRRRLIVGWRLRTTWRKQASVAYVKLAAFDISDSTALRSARDGASWRAMWRFTGIAYRTKITAARMDCWFACALAPRGCCSNVVSTTFMTGGGFAAMASKRQHINVSSYRGRIRRYGCCTSE